MELWIVQVEYDLTPVEVWEERLEALDEDSHIPGGGEFPREVGWFTSHTLKRTYRTKSTLVKCLATRLPLIIMLTSDLICTITCKDYLHLKIDKPENGRQLQK